MAILKKAKKAIVLATGVSLMLSVLPVISAAAAQEVSACVLFADGTGESILVDAQGINMNGDIVTNGQFAATAEYPGLNGKVYENQQNEMVDYDAAIQSNYFNGDINQIDGDYSPKDVNENISSSMEVTGSFISEDKNVAVNSAALMAQEDINIDGGSFSCSDGVIYSREGDIHIASDNFSASALIYAPNGTVYLECGNINMNGCVVAQSIEIVSGGVNLNKNENLMKKLGGGISADEALNTREGNDYKPGSGTSQQQQSQQQQQGQSTQQSQEQSQQQGQSTQQSQQQPQGQQEPQEAASSNGGQSSSTGGRPVGGGTVIPGGVAAANTDVPSGAAADTADNARTPSDASNASEQAQPESAPADSGETVGDRMYFENVSDYEINNLFDLFILFYQVYTGQKHIMVY